MNFIEKNTKKVAIVLSLATIASAVTTVYAASNSDGWYQGVYKEDGQIKTAWLFSEEGTYYLSSEGTAISGWKTVDGNTYYFNADGLRLSGVQVIDGHTYTFQEKSGKLLTGWQEENTKYYNQYGTAETGVQKIEGKTYNFDKNGVINTGWKTIDGKKVYFTATGSLATGKVKVDGKEYNFQSDGTVKKGWTKEGSYKQYYDDYGFRTKGWKTIKEKKYYFSQKGNLYTNDEIDGYKIDEDGVGTKIVETTSRTGSASNSNSSSSNSSRPASSGNDNPSASVSGGSVTSVAGSYAGYPYVWGGTSPSGFDCSGFTQYVFAKAGKSIPRSGYSQAGVGSNVSYGNMQAGDLIIWDGGSHVSIYMGGGSMIHAANPRRGVIYSGVSEWSSYGQSITSIRRA